MPAVLKPRALLAVGTLLAHASAAIGAIAQVFSPPASSYNSESANYTGQSNNTLQNGQVVPGKVFDRFIQIWFENTDCECASARLSKDMVLTVQQLKRRHRRRRSKTSPNRVFSSRRTTR